VRIPTTSQHHARLNLAGWVAPLLGRSGVVRTPRGDRAGFLQALRHLYRRLQRYTIWLYVDGAGWHRGVEVDKFLQTHPRLRPDYLPRYQPALNPQERVWRRIRYEATTNRWFPDLDGIWTTVQRTRQSWSSRKLKRLCHIG
jgi:transposase